MGAEGEVDWAPEFVCLCFLVFVFIFFSVFLCLSTAASSMINISKSTHNHKTSGVPFEFYQHCMTLCS